MNSQSLLKYWNFFVILLITILIGSVTHGVEQFLIQYSLSKLNIISFNSEYTLDLINWIPTLLVGFTLSIISMILLKGNNKIWWVLFASFLLVVYSLNVRKSLWYIEPSLLLSLVVDIRHFMYSFGALLGFFLFQLRNKDNKENAHG